MRQNNKNQLKKVNKVYSFWGKFSFLYDAQDVITFLGRAKTIRSSAVKKLGIKKGDKVLEVACGSGRNFPYLVEEVGRDGFILGFDYSFEMLKAAKKLCEKKGWHNIVLVQGDAGKLNIKENNFDAILSVLGISAIPDWENALIHCIEVLRPGGKLVVCDARLFNGFLKIFNPLIKYIYTNLFLSLRL